MNTSNKNLLTNKKSGRKASREQSWTRNTVGAINDISQWSPFPENHRQPQIF